MTFNQKFSNEIELPRVLVVILNWNGWEETLVTVDSVLRLDYPRLRVLIIDNGSVDESLARLEAIQDIRVELLKLPKNLGYAGGCNAGLRRSLSASVEYVWLLNSDAIVDDKYTLRSLVSLAESDPKIGLVSPRLADLKEPDRITFCGGVCSVAPPLWEHTSDPRQAQMWLEEYPHAGMVVGTAMLVRTSMIRDVGLLDEKLFAYFEDNDYSYRCSKAGYRVLVDEMSIVRHEEKDASGRLASIKPHWWYYMTRNECLFWIKHLGFIRGLRVSRWDFKATLYRMRQCKDNKAALDATLAGLWHGWTNQGGPYREKYRMPRLLAMVIRKIAFSGREG